MKNNQFGLTVDIIFRRLLTALWLRPERALWDAHELFWAGQYLDKDFRQPSLEYGCTEGTPSFIMLGGVFGDSFDDYREVDWQKDSFKEHQMLKSDYFDSFNKDLHIDLDIVKQPDITFEYGLSWKNTHIQKAKRLNIYKHLILRPLGDPLPMFQDLYFETIFAPNLFWVEKKLLSQICNELKRILRPNGRIITIFPDISQKECLLYDAGRKIDAKWMNDIDRGLHFNLTIHALSLKRWKEFFLEHKLKINRHDRFISDVVSQIYQIGMRPMFPVFMNMYEKLLACSKNDWIDVKKHWIDTAYHFLSPMCEHKEKNVWHIFEVKHSDQ